MNDDDNHFRLLLEELRACDDRMAAGLAASARFAAAGVGMAKAQPGRFIRPVGVNRPEPDFDGLLKSLRAMKADADVDLRATRHADLQRKFAECSAHFDEAIRSGKIGAVQAAKVETLMARLAAEAGLS